MELIFGGGKHTKCIDQPQFSSVALHASTVSCSHELSYVPAPVHRWLPAHTRHQLQALHSVLPLTEANQLWCSEHLRR